MVVIFYEPQVASHFRSELMKKMTLGGLLLRNEHRLDLNIPYPPASVPGQWPHRRTGRLRDGVLLEVDQTVGEVRVRSTTPYTLPLMRSGRRTLWHTLRRIQQQLMSTIGV